MNIEVWSCQPVEALLFYVDTSDDWVGLSFWRRHASFVNYTRNTSLASGVMSDNHGYGNKVTIETTLTKHRCAGQHQKLSPALLHLYPIKHSPVFASSGWPVIHTVGTSRLTLLTLRVTVANYVPTLGQSLCQHCISCLSPVALLISIRGDEKGEGCQGCCHGCHQLELTIPRFLSSNWSDWTKEGSTFILILSPAYFPLYFEQITLLSYPPDHDCCCCKNLINVN